MRLVLNKNNANNIQLNDEQLQMTRQEDLREGNFFDSCWWKEREALYLPAISVVFKSMVRLSLPV